MGWVVTFINLTNLSDYDENETLRYFVRSLPIDKENFIGNNTRLLSSHPAHWHRSTTLQQLEDNL